MIIGIGTDIININRIRKMEDWKKEKFISRCFHKEEQQDILYLKNNEGLDCYLAKRFAAKEAFFKALGTGVSEGVKLGDIAIRNDSLGKPNLYVYGDTASRVSDMLGIDYFVHVSLSDEKDFAVAFLVIEKQS